MRCGTLREVRDRIVTESHYKGAMIVEPRKLIDSSNTAPRWVRRMPANNSMNTQLLLESRIPDSATEHSNHSSGY